MPLPSRRPATPVRVTRHPSTRSSSARSSSGGFTQTGAAGFGQPAKAPSAPAKASAAPGPTPLPPDPAYQQQVGAIDQSTQTSVAGLTGDRDRTLLDYGYNVQYDEAGNPITSSLTFDPTNVFSRAAQLRKRWVEARSGTQNGMASAGQLNSGAYGRAQRQNNYGESQQTDAEIKGLTAFLARNGSQIAQAKIAGETAKGAALGESIARAPSNPLYDPARPAAAGSTDYNARPYKTQVVPGKGEYHIYPNGRKVFVRYT